MGSSVYVYLVFLFPGQSTFNCLYGHRLRILVCFPCFKYENTDLFSFFSLINCEVILFFNFFGEDNICSALTSCVICVKGEKFE